MAGAAAVTLEHSELEQYIETEEFELLRLLLQDHFDFRASKEVRLEEVVDAIVRATGVSVAKRQVESPPRPQRSTSRPSTRPTSGPKPNKER